MRETQLNKATWNVDESRALGQGGCGDVYAGSAVDGAPVAIKFLRSLGDDARELDVAAFFCSHPTKHLVPVLDYGVDAHSNRPCVVMKLANYSLRAKLTAVSQYSEADAVAILIDLCLGLIEATSWVHRDLKPENCLFLDGRWQLADFGCARQADAATATMTVRNVMTLPYAAPEQIYGLHATHATDVYALGCIGAELLSGQFAFAAPNFLREHLHGTPTILNASAKMHTLLLRMMAREGDVRPTIRAVLDELEAFKTPRTPAGRGSTRLLESYARYNNTVARAEAERIDTETKRQFRQDIAQTAVHELKTVGERLMDAVDVIAPGARQKLKEQTPPPQPPAHPSYPRQVQGQRQGATTPAVTELRHPIFTQTYTKEPWCWRGICSRAPRSYSHRRVGTSTLVVSSQCGNQTTFEAPRFGSHRSKALNRRGTKSVISARRFRAFFQQHSNFNEKQVTPLPTIRARGDWPTSLEKLMKTLSTLFVSVGLSCLASLRNMSSCSQTRCPTKTYNLT